MARWSWALFLSESEQVHQTIIYKGASYEVNHYNKIYLFSFCVLSPQNIILNVCIYYLALNEYSAETRPQAKATTRVTSWSQESSVKWTRWSRTLRKKGILAVKEEATT